MMTYEVFKDVVKERFMEYMPEKYHGMEINTQEVNKVNVTLDGLTLLVGERGVSPTIYINHMYEKYLETEDLQGTLQDAAVQMDKAMKNAPEFDKIDLSAAKDNIVFQLINTEQNKEMLENMPNRPFQDLSIIYRWVVFDDEKGIQSTIIKNNLAEHLGMDEEQLFKAAVENTRRIFKPTVKRMDDVIKDIFIKDGMPPEIAELLKQEIPEQEMLWVISNEKGVNGAITMLYEDVLQDVAKQLDSDLYILPASVHETIAVSADNHDPYELAQMVEEINMNEVSLDERLSNQVYHYDKDLRKLTMATDTPNKRLDGIVAEPQLVYDAGGRGR
ncbi:MAG: hypothetical protein J6L69_06695 [Lachnospiraceae bacterium]|nr:hypothetical protein [Lachnospiraceae bacterium]